MAAQTTCPVRVLREHTVALEAALTVCLSDPAHKAVHRLRIATRRLEAQLFLLSTLPGVPRHRRESRKLQRTLRQLRRAAGGVRDADAQDHWLAQLGERTTGESAEQEDVKKGVEILRRHLTREREGAQGKLRKLVHRVQSKAALRAEALVQALEPSAEISLSAGELLERSQTLLLQDGLLTSALKRRLTEEELHDLRKGAKAARYLAETLPDSSLVRRAARRYEALQDAGGQWHDALALHRAAKRCLGKGHALTALLAGVRADRLERYVKRIRVEAARVAPQARPNHAAFRVAKRA